MAELFMDKAKVEIEKEGKSDFRNIFQNILRLWMILRINRKKCSTIFPPIQNDLHSCYNHMLVSTKSGSKMFLPELSKQITILSRRFKIEQYKCVYSIGCLFTLCVHCTLTVYCLFFTYPLMLVVHVGQTRLQ